MKDMKKRSLKSYEKPTFKRVELPAASAALG